MNSIHVQMLPQFLDGVDLSRSTAVVIDVLRASTTIVHALGHGATRVIPCSTVDQAREIAARAEGPVLLGGERQGLRIEGFDLDNSPLSYTPDVVAGRTIVFTTTNGTRALAACAAAKAVLIGALVNLSAVVRELLREGGDVHLVCAGTDGRLTAEDILFAGCVVCRVCEPAGPPFQPGNVEAELAADFFRARSTDDAAFRRAMFDSLGGRNLRELGFDADIERSLRPDLFDLVPVWNRETGDVTPLRI